MPATNAPAVAPAGVGRWRARLAPLAAALVLAGCSFVPTYERPALPVATDWPIAPSGLGVVTPQELASATATDTPVVPAAGVGWRQFYQSPQLQQLIELALQNNRDLRIAVLNIEAARAQFNIQRSELAPTLGAGVSGQRQRVPGDLSPSGSAVTSSQIQVGVSMPSFEIDLFGRLRSLSEAALAQYLASEEARRNVQITLIAQVAEAWFNLYATAVQTRLTEQTLTSRQNSYDLVKARYDAGVGSALDLNQAETLLDTARSNLQTLQRLSLRARNALTVLTGVPNPPMPGDNQLLGETALLAEIPAGIPAAVLLARPDVLAAEQELRAANANIGAARAAFFPNISLTALLGTASNQLSGLFTGGSLTWNYAPQIAIPLFTGGALRNQLELAEVRRNIAVANYERTIQQAFREVSDALAGTATYQQQIQAENDLVDAAKRSLDLAQLRYDSGVDSYLQVHDAERTLYTAQQELVGTRLEELLNRVALYKALGGGWLAETEGPAPRLEGPPETNLMSAAQRDTRVTAPADLPSLATTPAQAATPASTDVAETPMAPAVPAPAPAATAVDANRPAQPVATEVAPAPVTPASGPAGTVQVLEQRTWRDAIRQAPR